MLSIQEISDRLEIQDLLSRYSYAVDFNNLDEFDNVFTEDALIDYSDLGGAKGSRTEIQMFLRNVLPLLAAHQHMVSTSQITIKGDEAHGRTICFSPTALPVKDGEPHVMFIGLWYRDTFVRTAQGWRIRERIEEKSYFYNKPKDFIAPAKAFL